MSDSRETIVPRHEEIAAPQREETREETVVPLHEETLSVGKRRVERGRVRVTTRVVEHEELAQQSLEHEDVEVTRVAVDRPIDGYPGIRQDGDTTIIPLVEEILVVERRLVLREEIHIRKTKQIVNAEEPVTLRAEEAVIERIASPDTPRPSPHFQSEE